MSQANFNFCSWSLYSHRLRIITTRDETHYPNSTIGLPGHKWNNVTDTLSLAPRQLAPANTFVTKTNVLQVPSQIYDSLGWITTTTVRAKILPQGTWQTKVSLSLNRLLIFGSPFSLT